jgi:hypothetical protein
MPIRTVGGTVAVTIPDDRTVILVENKKVTKFSVPGTGPLAPVVFFAGRVYAPETRAGVVHETDANGKAMNDIKMPTSNGTVELEVREGYLFINAPTARPPAWWTTSTWCAR